jgi:hypothetical protein
MKKKLPTMIGVGLLSALAAMPSLAEGQLLLTCTARDLAPGSHVWIEVEAQYQEQIAAGPAAGGFVDSSPRRSADAPHIWQFDVPASGQIPTETYEYRFPPDVDWTSSGHFGSIYLKTRFKIDAPGAPRPGYGEVAEVTFGMPVPAGSTRLSRCLRLRDEGDRLRVETASDCRESTFDKARTGGTRVHMGPTSRLP